MGKLDVKMMRYLSREDFRVLTAIEMGMKNHELVNLALIAQIANLPRGGLIKVLHELVKHELLCFERNRRYEGYRLTNKGYDYLALKALAARDLIDRFGTQIGVGKESNIYTVSKKDSDEIYCLKLHRLGRTCFKQVKNKRYYHEKRSYMSWLYLSRVSATKEFLYMTALYDRGFPVPKPIDYNRHCIIMELIEGVPLCNVKDVENKDELYDALMKIICKLAYCGVVHGDFNEFNIMITDDGKPIMIDFPQMISIDNEEAEMYFNRDVKGVRDFFRRRFDYESTMYPVFQELIKECKAEEKLNLNLSEVEIEENEDKNDSSEEESCSENEETSEKSQEKDGVIDEKDLEKKIGGLNIDATNLKDEEDHNNQSSEEDHSNESNEEDNSGEEMNEKIETSTKKKTSKRYRKKVQLTQEEIKQRVRGDLQKKMRKDLIKKNLKKSTISSKIRRENQAAANEKSSIWID
ncbi:serine/threonine-protein kinase RIO2 [Trichogramma pretiosum]|uniref:serine/threonine-protein kinase RIO2 n=1 Tax=Trichogramma pretiosum TaxID=7493 RepID=UPI0006C96A3C|nr:serine/threonine-protein kinase RIO2 [Trichogramma pretiosum]